MLHGKFILLNKTDALGNFIFLFIFFTSQEDRKVFLALEQQNLSVSVYYHKESTDIQILADIYYKLFIRAHHYIFLN